MTSPFPATPVLDAGGRRAAGRPQAPTDPDDQPPPVGARRILLVTAAASAVVCAAALLGLLVDPRTISGAPAWLKPAKFGISIAAYLLTMRWIFGVVRGSRRLLTAIAVLMAAVFTFETVWIVAQVVRNTTSHFNIATAADAAVFDAAGAAISLVFLATIVVAILALRTRGLDLGVAAGLRWGLAVSTLGMAEAVSMVVNGHTATTSGAHTVGAPDGGPGLPLTDWSLDHGDLRVAHFVGLHALQALPLFGWLLLRRSSLPARTRRRLVRVAGTAWAALVVLLWWQAERGQALLRPDLLTLAAVGVLLVLTAAAVLLVRRTGATPGGRRLRRSAATP